MYAYSVFWLCILGFTLVGGYLDSNSRRAFLCIAAVSVSIFCGLRYFSANDYEAYTWLYSIVPSIWSPLEQMREVPVDIGYAYISSLFSTIGLYDYLFLFLLAFASILSKAYILQKISIYPLGALFCYFCIVFYNSEFIQIRWALSLSLCYLASLYCIERPLRACSFLILACLFHIFSLVVCLVFFISYFLTRRLPGIYIALIGFFVFVFSFFINVPEIILQFLLGSERGYFLLKLTSYLQNIDAQIAVHVKLRYFAEFCVIFFVFYNEIKQPSRIIEVGHRVYFFYNVFFVNSLVCFIFLSFPIFATRLFILSDFIFVSLFINWLSLRFPLFQRKVLITLVILVFSVYGFLVQYSMYSDGVIYEYNSWIHKLLH